jgi:UDP-glucose 4-epimerase
VSRKLIIGGAGFIGSHLTRACVAQDDDVHVLVRPETDVWRIHELAGKYRLHRIATDNRSELVKCFAEVSPRTIFHLASQTRRPGTFSTEDARHSLDSEVRSVLTIMDAAAAVQGGTRIIRAGSLAEYGDGPTPSVEGQREMPLNIYAAGLVAGTHYAEMCARHLSIQMVTARLALTYGQFQSASFLVPNLIRNCMSSKPTHLNRPDDRRDLIAVNDIVAGLLALSTSNVITQGIVNLSSGIAPTVREIAETIADICNCPRHLLVFGDGSAPANGPKVFWGSPRLAEHQLSWIARTPYRTGLLELIQKMRSDYSTLLQEGS